jgi:hypothetical protein
MSGRPTQEEVREALAVLARASELEVYGFDDFPFWLPEPWERIGVAGMTRRGKSALMKAFCRYLMKKKRRLVVIDIDDEYSPEGVDRGEECALGPLRQRLTVAELLAQLARDPDFLNREDLALAIVPEDPTEDPEEVAAQVLAVAPHLRDADPLVILLEELGYWGEHAARLLHAVSARWGKRGHVPFFMGQCLTDCPEKARKQWSKVITGQQVKESDLIFLQRQAGEHVRRAVAVLPRKRFVVADLDRPRPEDLEQLAQ